MNMKIFFLAAIISFNISLFAQKPSEKGTVSSENITVEQPEESSFEWMAGVSFIPITNWQFLYIFGDERLTYDIQSRSSAYEVNFRMWPFSFGTVAVTDDNIIGKVSKIMGYIGYDRFSVKIARSDLRGTGHWSGPYGYDTEPSFKLHNKIETVDLLYNGRPGSIPGLESWYAGLTYTDFTMPLQIYTTEYAWNGGGGEPFYDEKFGGKSYGITFGFNRLKNRNKPSGFDIFAISQDWFTGGKYSLSDRAVKRGEALNPGYVIGNEKVWGTYLTNETALGLSWTYNFTGGDISFAVGYDLIWGMVGAFTEFSGTEPGVIDWEQDNFFFRHGVIFCVYGTW